MWDIKLLVVGLLVVLISHWVYTWSWRNPKSNGKLPPGSMGLPFIGETIQYFNPKFSLWYPALCSNEGGKMVFDYFSKMMMGYEESMGTWKLRDCYNALLKGIVSFPLNIPGTTFHACMEGRRNAAKVIQHILNERKRQSKAQHHDFAEFLLEVVKRKDNSLDEEGAVDLVFVLLFASPETVSSAITLAINFLAHNPSVLHQLTKEQTEFAKRLEMRKSKMTWEDYRAMSFTHMVMNETIRLGNIVPIILRKVIKDVEIKGYTIPTGWYMMLCPPSVHLDPVKYEDPLSFNPWRWQGKELHVGTKSFIAFGGAARLCA
ncbi:hypothetical protein Ancab_032626 [Ancistrocladus abbreviatus]